MHSRNFLPLFLFYISTLVTVSSENVNFKFQSFSLRNLTLLGDSHLRNGVIGLTRELEVPSSSSGTAIYNTPVQFFDPNFNITASFSTSFAFFIDNINPNPYGDGLSFFISPDNDTLGSPGGYLGLVNSHQLTKNRFVAVEFDTRLDLYFNDPDDNHVGLDIDSLISIKTANLMTSRIDLKSGDLITAWIDYKNEEKKLLVFASYSSLKPEDPLLHIDIDLSDYLSEFMYLGFSASTEGSTEMHFVESWTFQTEGFSSIRPRIHPHNVSDNTVALKPPIPVLNSSKKHHQRVSFGLGIAGPFFFGAVLLVLGWITFKKWSGIKTEKSLAAELVTGPRKYSFKELMLATRGFHSSRVLGHGSFGTVYKALFINSGTIFAVKRSKHSHEGKTEFLAELSIIGCLRHKNLVQLQGWCMEKGELLLVYDFMPNGSLDNVLYQESRQGNPLEWHYRYNIAVGLASALTYLHQECEQQVIHRDIKTSNIMLDGCFNAKLSDFGLARLMDHDQSPVSTLTAGTMGYLAPEYLQYGKATEKTDVFSYGVVILEVASGRRAIEREGNDHKMVNLVDWVWKLHSQGKIMEAADKRLGDEYVKEEMRKLLLIGLSCANPDSAKRPTIRRVFQILKNEAEPMLVPKMKPSLTFSNNLSFSIDDILSSSSSSSSEEEECKTPDSHFQIVVK